MHHDVHGETRRTFIKKTAAGLSLAAMGAAAPNAGAKTDWKMRLSTSSIHYMGLPIEEACARIAELGFEGVDIWSAHADCPHLDDVLERLGPEKLAEVLDKLKLKLFSFSVYQGGYPKYAELLGKAGGGVAVHSSATLDKNVGLAAQMKKYVERLKPEIELAERYDSYVAIENHSGSSLLNTLDSLKAFVDANTSPRIGIALAPYHLQSIKVSVPEAIGVCGKQLFFFYAWQKAEGNGQLPGIGPADMKPWIAALAEIQYKGYVNPFMHGHPEPDEISKALTKSKDYLAKCYEEL